MSSARYRAGLGAILAAGALLRLGTILAIPTQPVSDFRGYFVVAKNLATIGRYETGAGVDAKRSPAYPVLLSLAHRVAAGDGALVAAKLINIVLFLMAGLAGAALARRLGNEAAGLWTAAILAFLPRSVLMTDLLAAENLIAPLLLAYLLLCASSWTGSFSPSRAAGLGVLAGLLCLTRAVFYLVPLVWLAGALAGRLGGKRVVRELLIVLVAAHAVLLPWAIRNARAVGRFTPLNLVGGIGLFIANNPNATGHWYAWEADLERLRPGTSAGDAAAVDDAARSEAWRWMREHPADAARGYLKRLAIVLADDGFVAEFAIFAKSIPQHDGPVSVLPRPHALESSRSLVRLVLRVSGVLLAAAGLGGFAILLVAARRGSLPDRALAAGVLAAALYVPLLSSAMAVNGRYRWAAEDVAAPLAGLCLSRLSRASAGRGPSPGTRPSGRG